MANEKYMRKKQQIAPKPMTPKQAVMSKKESEAMGKALLGSRLDTVLQHRDLKMDEEGNFVRKEMDPRTVSQRSTDFTKALRKESEIPNPGLGEKTIHFNEMGPVTFQEGNPGGLKTKKKMDDMQKGGMMYEEGGEVKSKVMSMLDGMKDMPAEAEVVKMIVEKHGVSEDQAKAMIAEYKKSKMGMGGKTEYEGGGAMKMMRDPKDMVGMAMGGARIIS